MAKSERQKRNIPAEGESDSVETAIQTATENEEINTMATATAKTPTVHLLLGHKGGIGKTYIGSLLAQEAIRKGEPWKVFDLDQSNQMLADLPSLHAEGVVLRDEEDNFSVRLFDALLEKIMDKPDTYLLDLGASTYPDAWARLVGKKYFELLRSVGVRIVLHVILNGGGEMKHVLTGFEQTANVAKDGELIVWMNNAKGKFEMGGRVFTDMPVFHENASKVAAIITLPAPDEPTADDLTILMQEGQTMTTVDQSELLRFFSKHRVRTHAEEVFSAIDAAWEVINGGTSVRA